ncbi:hypothetical protein BsWGS_14488 [Bradybaena similaris]
MLSISGVYCPAREHKPFSGHVSVIRKCINSSPHQFPDTTGCPTRNQPSPRQVVLPETSRHRDNCLCEPQQTSVETTEKPVRAAAAVEEDTRQIPPLQQDDADVACRPCSAVGR